MMKSAVLASLLNRSLPASVSQFRVTLLLPALKANQKRLLSGSAMSSKKGGILRAGFPSGFSTWMTSAPRSARILPHKRPFSSVKSKARYGLNMSSFLSLPHGHAPPIRQKATLMNHRQTHIRGLGSVEDCSFSKLLVSSIYYEVCICNLLWLWVPV